MDLLILQHHLKHFDLTRWDRPLQDFGLRHPSNFYRLAILNLVASQQMFRLTLPIANIISSKRQIVSYFVIALIQMLGTIATPSHYNCFLRMRSFIELKIKMIKMINF